MTGFKRHGYGFLAGLVLLLIASAPAWAADRLDIQPAVVEISSFFSGVQMHISADVPPGCQAVVRVRGKRIESELMRKAHRWELWLNSGEVDIGNTPGLYIALSSDPQLLAPDSGDYPWGYEALEKEADFSGHLKPSEDDTIFKEFVELKERDHLYRLYPGGLKITPADSGPWQAEADFHLPSRLKRGTYKVALWIVRDGKVIERRDSTFEVQRVGLPQVLHSLAMNHGVFYGFLAVVIAMLVGMLTGIAFQRKGGGH